MAKDLDMAILLDVYGAMLTEKQADTLYLYYNEDLSLAEIAENTGITRQGVHKCIRSAEQYLTQLEETLGYAKKYQILKQATDRLEELALAAADGKSEELAAIKQCIEEIRNNI